MMALGAEAEDSPFLLLLEPRPLASCWEGIEALWEEEGLKVQRASKPPLPSGWAQALGILLGEDALLWREEWPSLMRWVEQGGRMLLWRVEDRRAPPELGLQWSDREERQVEFPSQPHPLIRGWQGQRLSGTLPLAQDVVQPKGTGGWRVLAQTSSGAALVVRSQGRGELAVAQWGVGFLQRFDLRKQWARNVMEWLQVSPSSFSPPPLPLWLSRLLEGLMEIPPPRWPANGEGSLLMMGLLEAGETLGRSQAREYVAAWLLHHQGRLRSLDLEVACLAAPAVRLGRLTQQPQWNAYPQRVWEWLWDTAPKAYNAALFSEGRHLSLATLYPLPAWLAEWGATRKDPVPLRFAAWQLSVHLTHLLHPETGWLRHAWDADARRAWGELWGQGNARALLGLVETLRWLPPKEGEGLREQAQRLQEALLRAQRPSGAWPLLLDDPQGPEDFLTTALLAAALERSPAPPEGALERAFQWISGHLRSDGRAPSVFPSLPPGYRERYLRASPRPSPAGDGALLLFLASRWQRLRPR